MSTLYTSKKTDRRVLPQPSALETVSADNLGVRTKRGTVDSTRKSARNAGVQHGRGETVSEAPLVSSVTVVPDSSGQPEPGRKPRQVVRFVPVLGKDGVPLMPTHPARARELLRKGRAVVANHTPFVIRLKDRSIGDDGVVVQDMGIGIDPGSKHTGFSVFTVQAEFNEETGEVTVTRSGKFSLQVDHRSRQISQNLTSRALLRRTRRSRKLRYRSRRFLNRKTKLKGWLVPSLQHLVTGTYSMTRKLMQWFPVTEIHQELVSFDIQRMMNPEISGIEYQRGTLFGSDVREYLLKKFNRTCVYCGAHGIPLNLDHVTPRSKGGSNAVSNLVLACVDCNQKKGNRPVEEFLKDDSKLAALLTQMRRPLRDAAAMNTTRWAIHSALKSFGVIVHTGSAGLTKFNRTRNGLPKTHCTDAISVGTFNVVESLQAKDFIVRQAGRGTYQRAMPDKHGFARAHRSRQKSHSGFITGDLVRAVVPKGKYRGTHIGRVAVRTKGAFLIDGKISSHPKNLVLLQRGNGWSWKA